MGAYPPHLLDEIRASIDIVDLVGRYVTLRRAGQSFKGLCPFHAERTPSFMVNPARRIFHCFGCGAGGDAFGFLMRQERLAFPEAVRALARQAGIPLPEERGDGESAREELYRVMDLAARFYVGELWGPAGARARRYLEERGVDPEVARRFGLGFAPEGWENLLGALKGQGVSEALAVAAGLAVPREGRAGAYDRFRGRLLFTIRDLQGRPVAFGGRALGDEQPKYLNSPETPLYTKGNLLYGADLARPAIQQKNRALLVEGYVDCLMAHQHGFTETVAALGTAFTPAQLALLRRYTGEVVTFFDADAAGARAAERAEELLEPTGQGLAWGVNRAGGFASPGALRVRVAVLPSGHDPDTFLRAEGAAALEALVAGARSLLSYALERALTDSEGATGARARTTGFARAALLLAKVTDAEEATALSREAAVRLGVDPTQLWIEAQRLATSLRRAPTPARPAPPAAPPAVERDLVGLLLRTPEARARLLPLLDEEADLTHPALRAVVTALRARPGAEPESLLGDLAAEEAREALAALLIEEFAALDVRASIDQFARRLERNQRLRRARGLSRALAQLPGAGQGEEATRATLRSLHEDTAALYAMTGGVAQSLDDGTLDAQGAHADE